MITRERLKREIDNVRDEYIIPLYKIIKAFEEPEDSIEDEMSSGKEEQKKEEWKNFIDKFAGSLADTPIERGDQGKYEVREPIL
ncbi:MAG: hypothetical protein ACM3SY_21305 [Candidatus Omnitrophota bacterium]